MTGVYIEPQDGAKFGLDIQAIEAATGRTITAIWRNSDWFDNAPELEPHAYGTPGYRRIMSSIEIYFDCGQNSQKDDNTRDTDHPSHVGTSQTPREGGRAD